MSTDLPCVLDLQRKTWTVYCFIKSYLFIRRSTKQLLFYKNVLSNASRWSCGKEKNFSKETKWLSNLNVQVKQLKISTLLSFQSDLNKMMFTQQNDMNIIHYFLQGAKRRKRGKEICLRCFIKDIYMKQNKQKKLQHGNKYSVDQKIIRMSLNYILLKNSSIYPIEIYGSFSKECKFFCKDFPLKKHYVTFWAKKQVLLTRLHATVTFTFNTHGDIVAKWQAMLNYS